ncbi:MAG: hypothetical protein KAJ55_07335 [Anaerolineales bacterium]|nr:hypothetical protein [Anaerolineales bacterium]
MKQLTTTQKGISIGAVVAFMFGGGGSLVVWGADQRYAQKEDIDALGEIVEENSKAQTATVSSVDVLLVQVLDIVIEDLETEIRELEGQTELTAAEASLLADDRRALADASTERNATLTRILARRSN